MEHGGYLRDRRRRAQSGVIANAGSSARDRSQRAVRGREQ